MAIKIPIVTEFKNKGVKDAERTLASFGKSVGVAFAAAGAALGVAGAGIVAFGKDAVGAASTLEESLNAVRVAYGDASKDIVKLGEDAATRLGVTQSAFNAAAVRFSAFAERVVGDGGDVTGFLDDITTRAADFASVFNIDVAEALQVFQSGLSGEAEPLKRFGINLLDSEVKAYALRAGIGAVGRELTETEKVQARYGLLMESTNKTAGDFANTSDSLANSQRILQASFQDLQADVGTALLPVMADLSREFADMLPTLKSALTPAAEALAEAFRTSVLPAIRDFTEWLASPEGTEAVKDLVNSIVTGITEFAKFTVEVIKNKDEIIKNIGFALALGGAIKTITTVTDLSRAAMLLFNVALKANPIGMLITALGLAAVAVVVFTKEVTEAEKAIKKKTNNTIKLRQEQIQLMEKIKQGGIEVNAYKKRLKLVGDELMQVKTGMSTSAGEANRFSNALKNSLPNLSKYRSQLGDTRVDAQRLVEAQRELAYYMNGGKPGTYKPMGTTPAGGGGGGGKSPAQEAADAAKAVSKLIKDSREKVVKAEQDYRKAVSEANREYLENEKKIRADFAGKVADIIQQSKDRIRDAFKSVAGFGIGSFLNIFKTAEDERKRAFEDAQKAAKDAGKAFTDSFVAADPLKAFLDSLRNKVAQNKRVLETSGKLLEAGFSQSFIEQIITTGEDGGLALAEGLLASNPEIIKEVQDLYQNIENIAETGADSLADTLYEKQGLASRQLNELLAKTQNDLLDALNKNYDDYLGALDTAAEALRDAIKTISDDFDDEIEGMNGKLGGLGAAIKAFKESLGGKADDIIEQPQQRPPFANFDTAGIATTAAAVQDATGILIDSVDDLAGVFGYLNERIAGAQTYLTKNLDKAEQARAQGVLSSLIAQRSQLSDAVTTGTAVGTVININVKTSSDQSLAMVGKTLGNTITKYVTTGGQVLVSSGSPVG